MSGDRTDLNFESANDCRDIRQLVPHAGRMSLLDDVTASADEWLEAQVTVRAEAPYAVDGEVGAWFGIEYMAQAVAAYAGLRARRRGEAVRIGLLVGTRRYESSVPVFAANSRLRVRAERRYESDNGIASFACSIRDDEDATLAEAVLTVYQPADAITFIHGGAL
jgi:predicted hotdog family 3-hydroxylacyl-ACP dehydratase